MLDAKKIIKRFQLKVANKDKAVLSRSINSPAIHRLGLELLDGAELSTTKHNVVGWGTKESKFLKELSPVDRISTIEKVLNDKTPLILLSVGVTEEITKDIVEIANKFEIPVCTTNQHLSNITTTIGWYIVKYLSESKNNHGSLVVVNGVGVMIIGKSGIGKSEAVLELIQGGSLFVSDDTVVIKRIGTDFIGESAELTKDFLEARGIGIIDIPKIYGLRSTREFANIDLVIELVPSEKLHEVDRLGDKDLKFDILGGTIDKMQIPVDNGRSISSLIEAAVNVYMAKVHGHNPLEVISERNK